MKKYFILITLFILTSAAGKAPSDHSMNKAIGQLGSLKGFTKYTHKQSLTIDNLTEIKECNFYINDNEIKSAAVTIYNGIVTISKDNTITINNDISYQQIRIENFTAYDTTNFNFIDCDGKPRKDLQDYDKIYKISTLKKKNWHSSLVDPKNANKWTSEDVDHKNISYYLIKVVDNKFYKVPIEKHDSVENTYIIDHFAISYPDIYIKQ